MKTKIVLFLSVACLTFLVAGCETTDERASASASGLDVEQPGLQDQIFIWDALAASAREVELARLGIDRAENLDLQLLAQRIHDDHTRARRELLIIADREGFPLPTEAPAEARAIEFSNLSGPDFDRLYVQHIVRTHGKNIKKLEAAARDAQNLEIRDFAAKVLPSVEEHLRMAENIGIMAGAGDIIDEASGAERGSAVIDPYYNGNSRRRHQFEQQ